jgi:hypothetical protein
VLGLLFLPLHQRHPVLLVLLLMLVLLLLASRPRHAMPPVGVLQQTVFQTRQLPAVLFLTVPL